MFERLTTELRANIRRAIEGIDDPVEQMRAALRADLGTTERDQDEILRAGDDRRVFAGDPRLAADIIAVLCSLVALRRWNLRQRFAGEDVREGLAAYILRALGVREGGTHARAQVARS